MLNIIYYIVTQIIIFTNNFLNVDNLINIAHNLIKLSVLILDMLMEGTMSQNFELCLSFYFMSLDKLFLLIFLKSFPIFVTKKELRSKW